MSNTNDLIFVNYILDNVHGFIGLTTLEDQIEHLPIFKRLQDISQLGLVKRIFPGALHNRYIHSLGVMHVIDQMALHLGKFNSAERQLLRLAGMLHDLGHYPLSHDLEQVYDSDESATGFELPTIKETFLLDAQKDLYKITGKPATSPDDDVLDSIQIPERELVVKKRYHHETVTTRVIRASSAIKNILKEGIRNGSFNTNNLCWDNNSSEQQVEKMADTIINDICALIQGDGDYDYTKGAFPEYFTAMLQMLHSELDADRIDYLLRDATFSGASYGSFDVGVLLQNLDMKKCTIGDLDAWIVGVKVKGIGCADQYMVNRYLAYTQVIFHKYTSIVGKMLREVVHWMMNNSADFTFYTPKQLDAIIRDHEKNKSYLAFTDSYFFQHLNSIHKETHGCPDDIYYFIDQLRNYRSLDMESEDVFAGNLNQQKNHILDSALYKHLADLELKDGGYPEKSLYLLNKKKITNHLPFNIFKENFEKYNNTHDEKLNYNKYQLDRLMDGLAVIDDNKEPYLLIDAPRSMITELYDVQQVMLRRYGFG